MGHPRSVGESILLIQLVIVSRNLDRANENDGFKMTALEYVLKDTMADIANYNTLHTATEEGGSDTKQNIAMC